jgi:hypothetical protein
VCGATLLFVCVWIVSACVDCRKSGCCHIEIV